MENFKPFNVETFDIDKFVSILRKLVIHNNEFRGPISQWMVTYQSVRDALIEMDINYHDAMWPVWEMQEYQSPISTLMKELGIIKRTIDCTSGMTYDWLSEEFRT